jgi:hypothetical protein
MTCVPHVRECSYDLCSTERECIVMTCVPHVRQCSYDFVPHVRECTVMTVFHTYVSALL